MCGAEYASRSWIAALRFGFTKYRQSSSYYNPSESSTQIHFESAYQADQGLIIGFGAEEYWNWETYPTADSDVRLDYNRAGVFGDAKFRLTGRLFSKVGVRLGSGSLSASPTYEPRLFMAYEADRSLFVKWNAGIYRSFYDDNILVYTSSSEPREAYYTEISLGKSFDEITEVTASAYYKC